MLRYTVILTSEYFIDNFRAFLLCNSIPYEHVANSKVFIITTDPDCAEMLRHSFYVDYLSPYSSFHVNSLAPMVPVTLPNPDNDDVTWPLKRINAIKFWQTTGFMGENINIAILDSGVALHDGLDIKKRLSFVDSDPDVYDTLGHGTLIAGILGANPNKCEIAGIAYKANLYSLKIGTQDAEGNFIIDTNAVLKALQWCLYNNIYIVNMSFGYDYVPSEIANIHLIQKAIKALYSYGIIVVSGTGNKNQRDKVEAPALFTDVLGVGSTDFNDNRWVTSPTEGSNYGLGLDFMAPGDKITSTFLNNGYAETQGTSFSVPYVAGLAALFLSQDRTLNFIRLKEKMIALAKKLPAGNPDSVQYGYGLIQALPQ